MDLKQPDWRFRISCWLLSRGASLTEQTRKKGIQFCRNFTEMRFVNESVNLFSNKCLTSNMTILPLKIAMKCRGSFPIVTLTWTGLPPCFWSKVTAWNAEAATSSCVACRPWKKSSFLPELISLKKETKKICHLFSSPAKCRAGKTLYC